ncbi:nephrin [Hyalella azteca]|uniref:Nephrin n=1 Tax=Hyalella azteca TaxID=294128 RepID=A0A979FUF9_HYAAZ|nr:nephrin [Hyalella azteca]
MDDHGDFSCRVEYVKSPTTTAAFTLFVIVPPGPPTITWSGQPVVEAVGPLQEGQHAELVCTSVGGRPPPSVTWWKGDKKIGAREEVGVSGGGVMEISSKIRVFGGRDLAFVPLKCKAQIHPRGVITIPPRIASVTLNVTLPPLQVEIRGGEHPANEGSSVRLVCVTSGSHPPAVVTWWKGGSLITSVTHTMADGGNVTSAAVVLSVTSEEDGTVVTCQSKNPALPSPALTDSLTLSVLYEPRVELQARDSVTQLKEGESAELLCRVRANPPAHLYAWYLNGAAVVQDSVTVVRAGRLSLPSVRPHQAGRYTCEATNIIGATTSNALHITVLHKPRCAKGFQSRSERVARGDTVRVTCRVDASPATSLAYTWTRLTDDGRETLLPYMATNDGLTSTIEVTPVAVADYQTLVCRAANSIGRQQEGCQVTLIPSGPPDPPYDCRGEAGAEKGSLVVTCIEGFNGGLPQQFTLQAWQSDTLVANMTSEFPEWGVGGLAELKELKVQISAHNQQGSSDVLTLDLPNIAATQQLQDRHRLLKQKDTELLAPGWLPAVLGGIVSTLVLLLVVLLVSVTILHRRRRRNIRRRQDSIKQMMAKSTPEDDEVATAFTAVHADATKLASLRHQPDVLLLKPSSRQSTRTSTPLDAENGSRLHLNPCSDVHSCHSPCGHACEEGSLLAALQIHHNPELAAGSSSVCSDTDSDNAVLCSPTMECRSIHSPHCSALRRGHTHSVCSPTRRVRCMCMTKHSPHSVMACRSRAEEVRLGSQEAEDSGLEDTVGSAENLSASGCPRCLINASSAAPPRQSFSSPDINVASSGSLNKLQQCRWQQSLKRISIDGQSSGVGRPRARRTHFASIHKPSASQYFDEPKYVSLTRPFQGSASTATDKKPLFAKDNAAQIIPNQTKNLKSPSKSVNKIAPLSPCRESEV